MSYFTSVTGSYATPDFEMPRAAQLIMVDELCAWSRWAREMLTEIDKMKKSMGPSETDAQPGNKRRAVVKQAQGRAKSTMDGARRAARKVRVPGSRGYAK